MKLLFVKTQTSCLSFLFLSQASAAPKSAPPIVTNFLTEEDLNRALMKFIYWLAAIGIPIIIIESVRAYYERKRSLSKDAKDLRETVNRLETVVERLEKREEISFSDVRNISRDEAEKVYSLLQRAGKLT